jgi:UDP-N-acetylmuramoyl-tripeptide--D-alanyl-D-alanine ligase
VINNTIGELVQVIGAVIHGGVSSGRMGAQVTDLVVDSRLAGPGSLFFALPGERVDGHDYAAKAWQAGAVAAVTSRPVTGGLCLVVEDPQAALGAIGRHVTGIAKRAGLQVIGLTGSAGKTTTKDLLAQILEQVTTVVAPKESMNNEIGLPLTAGRITADTRYLISEMGAKGVGHIRYLCELTPPDVGLELNVGIAHVGRFGSRDAIAKAKGELVEALPDDGVAVLNLGDPRVRPMAARTKAPVTWFAVEGDDLGEEHDQLHPLVFAAELGADELDRWSFQLTLGDRQLPVSLQILGRHQVSNAVAAAATAYAIGVDPEIIAETLSTVRLRSHWRMELHELPGEVAMINDAYNANPVSMAAALEALSRVGENRRAARAEARTIAVLGEMLELGEDSAAMHEEVGRTVVGHGVQKLITVGSGAGPIGAGALAAGMPAENVRAAPDKAAVIDLLADRGPGDVILIKASRDVGLETIGEQLLAAR